MLPDALLCTALSDCLSTSQDRRRIAVQRRVDRAHAGRGAVRPTICFACGLSRLVCSPPRARAGAQARAHCGAASVSIPYRTRHPTCGQAALPLAHEGGLSIAGRRIGCRANRMFLIKSTLDQLHVLFSLSYRGGSAYVCLY